MNYQFELAEVDFRMIRELIHDRSGIYLKDEKLSFVRMKLTPRVSSLGLNSFNEYYHLLKYGPNPERELSKALSLLTNNETYFFRETAQLELYRDVLLKKLKEEKTASRNKSIRVLSAGCSTGEEVYTLAMLAFETGGFFWGWDLKITGMDISERALDVAQKGVYYPRSFRMTEQKYVEKFFSANSGDYLAKNSIKQLTSFRLGNITDPSTWGGLKDLDIIFCRNVLIYFSEDKVKLAIENFHRALNKGGYLLLGHSETLTGIYDEFKPLRFPETIVYQKRLD